MKKRAINSVIVLSIVCVLGVLFFQAVWHTHSMQNSYNYFDRTVKEAMNEAVSVFEKKRLYNTFQHKFIPDSLGSSEVRVLMNTNDTAAIDINIVDTVMTVGNLADTIKYINRKERQMVLIGDSPQRIEKRVGTIVNEIVDELKRDTLIERFIQKPTGLDTLLKNTFTQKGITTGFEFAIRGAAGNILQKSGGFDQSKVQKAYKVLLYPLHISPRPEELLVQVPNRTAEVIKSVWPILISSFVFTIVIIVTFWLTIRIILKQKKLSVIKNDFINNMTHEFKTPIATIGIAADALRGMSANPEQINHFAGIIKQESQNMNQKVETILQMALLEQQRVQLNIQPLDIHEILSSTLKHLALQLEKSGAVIATHWGAQNPLVLGDALHITNVFANVIDNAIKYSEGVPRLQIDTKNLENHLLIAFTDTGIGMNKEEQKRVFDKFYRAQSGNVHNTKGFGLGLSYAYDIVSKHKGIITIDSEKNLGTTVTIQLPLAHA